MISVELGIQDKTYRGAETPVLQDLHLVAGAGQFLAIVGPSGAGKSTMLNIVGGLDKDFEGEVRVGGQSLHASPPPAVRCGFVFQEPRLMPWMTVIDNLRLVMPGEPDARTRAEQILAQVGLSDALDQYPGQLSGGMQRRVALARAFVVRPALLLLDEPFISLDAPTAGRLRELLLELYAAQRPTVLLVTHGLREALALADRVVFLSGRPARVVLDLPVRLQRRGDAESAEVAALHHQLLERHPGLLSGLAVEEGGGSPKEAGAQGDSGKWRKARYP